MSTCYDDYEVKMTSESCGPGLYKFECICEADGDCNNMELIQEREEETEAIATVVALVIILGPILCCIGGICCCYFNKTCCFESKQTAVVKL